ncbi:hypothetical protein ACET3Z_013577 [Daucus carota]
MLEYAKANNYRIDLYVKHFFLEEGSGQTSNDIYSHVCPDEHVSNESMITCKDAQSSTDDHVGAIAVLTPTIVGDTTALSVEDDQHPDCILEMDVHEAPMDTQVELHGPSEGLVSQVIKGKQTLNGEAPVQQFKTHVGGTELVSATLTKNGSFVYTQGALTKALAAAKRKVGEGNSIAS